MTDTNEWEQSLAGTRALDALDLLEYHLQGVTIIDRDLAAAIMTLDAFIRARM